MDLNGVIAVLFVLALIIVIGAPGCQSQPPTIGSIPTDITPAVKAVAKQARVVDEAVDDVLPALGDKGTPLKRESEKMTGMADALVPKAEAKDANSQKNYEAAQHFQKELDDRQKKIDADKRMMLYLKIGALVVLVVFAGIIAFKTTGWLRTLVLIGLGGGGVGIGISIALDFIAPYVWILVALVVIAAVAALGRRLGWWEWAALGIAEAVKDTKAVAVATAAADKTPDGLGAVLKKEGLFIQPE